VANITQSGDAVTVTTANGSQLTADYVIVTVPLGVLKQGSIRFEPPLPADKQEAITIMVRTTAQHV
jgi:monoamine oxidase